jgi:serine/threonine-protein kinase
MGTVYRARDTRLNRQVAIKTLSDTYALTADRVARFEREAQLLAALNHPHIAGIYGVEQVEGTTYLVLELIDGPSLADRLAAGPLTVAEALPLARQIADALQAAHDKGIIHRDLKPANVMLADGHVKVLDFGLGKAVEHEPAADASNSPTITVGATQAGMLLGTAAYMSPEQAKGQVADKRSDVWAFGCVLYEMLTGTRAFHGDDVSDTLAAVLRADPDWTRLPADLPPAVRALLEGCLQKQRRARIADVSTAIFAIDRHAALAPGLPSIPPPFRASSPPLWKRSLPVLAASAITAAIVSAGWWSLRPAPARQAPARFVVSLPRDVGFTNTLLRMIALSPDGSRIVFVANNRLFVRPLNDLTARPVAGTDTSGGPLGPVFSPDGREIAFWSAADRTIKRISVDGGVPVTASPALEGSFAMSWDEHGLLVALGDAGVIRVSDRGGVEQIVTLDKAKQESAYGPQLLPGGRHLLVTMIGGTSQELSDRGTVVVYTIDSGARKVLVENATDGRYLPTGQLVYVRGGTVFAAPFDASRLELGPEVPVVEGVWRGLSRVGHFAVSSNGVLAYIPGPASLASNSGALILTDRSGGVTDLPLRPGNYDYPRASPDGKSIAFQLSQGGRASVWVYPLSGGTSMRNVTLVGQNRHPVWSGDSSRLAFQSDREGDLGIFAQRADSSGAAVRLTKPETGVAHVPESWSPDGEHLLFSAAGGGKTTLWVLRLRDGHTEPFGGVASVNPTTGAFSPDGKWVAYASNAGREHFVYVQPFPATGEVHQISKEGENGHHPMWSWTPRRKELLYIPQVGRFVAVGISTAPGLTFTDPSPVPRRFPISNPVSQRPWDVAPDGRILSVSDGGQALTPEIRVVLNWFDELRGRVPVR